MHGLNLTWSRHYNGFYIKLTCLKDSWNTVLNLLQDVENEKVNCDSFIVAFALLQYTNSVECKQLNSFLTLTHKKKPVY